MRATSFLAFTLLASLAVSTPAHAQTGMINGASSVTYGTQTLYTFESDFDLFSPDWSVTNGTIIYTNSPSAYYTEVSVYWGTAGTGTVTLTDGYQLDSKQVTVRPHSPSASNVSRCGTGTVNLSATPGSGANSIRWYNASTGGSPLHTGTTYSPSISSTTTYHITSYSTSGNIESSPRISVTATVNSVPSAPGVSGNARWGPGTLTLTGSGAPGGGTYNWYNPSDALLHTGASYQTPTLSSSQSNYAYARTVSSAGCESSQTWVSVTIEPLPVITAPANRFVIGGPTEITLETGTGYNTYAWKNKAGTTLGTSQTYDADQPDEYRVEVTKSGLPGAGVSDVFTLYGFLKGQDMNYIVANTVLAPGTKQQEEIAGLSINSVSQVVQYFDGLGRLVQTVSTQASPGKKDLVQPVEYDALGRETKKYLPYAATSIDGLYKPEALTSSSGYAGSAQYEFYQATGGNIANDQRPFSEIIFEPSPLNRPDKEYGPGKNWHDNSRYVKFEYTTNTHGTASGQEKIIVWEVASDVPVRYTTLNSGYYPSNSLIVKVLKDEQGNQVREYTTREGKMILKKVQAVAGVVNVNNDNQWAQTYYIHDYKGQLRFVLQPELVKELTGNTNNPNSTQLSLLAFQHRYDSRGREVEKQVPGAKPVYMVYDKRDRLVLTQDGNQRTRKEWSFTKYDTLNRPVMTGLYSHGDSVSRAYMTTLINTNRFAEYYDETEPHGYTTDIFPNTNLTVNTVMFYDSYTFRDDLIPGSAYDFDEDHLAGQDETFHPHVLGLATGTKVNILGGNDYLWSVNYYDSKSQIIQTVAQNHKDSLDRTTNIYDFTGKVLESKTTHSTGTATYTIKRTLEYDHAGRPLKTWHRVNDEDSVMLIKNTYNEIGQLINKDMHSRNAEDFAQQVHYRYNIRGWLSSINDPILNPNALFNFQLKYNNPVANGGDAQYNGNISQAIWKTAGNDESSYGYEYDAMNRLEQALYYNHIRPGENGRYNEIIKEGSNSGYDLNGNIQKLQRNGSLTASTYGLMDDLAYTYTGNQLTRIDDTVPTQTHENGFKELSEADNEYAYDANGSMVKDDNKGITAIKYNYLNLPITVKKNGADSVVYTYDATGRKLRQQVYGAKPKVTEYVGGFIYENDTLRFIQHEEGRILPDTSSTTEHAWEYQYHLKDHLGNVRVTFSEKTTTEEFLATMETETNNDFLNYGNRSSFDLFNHTDAGTYSQLLNGGNNSQIGLAKSFEVNAGDVLDLEVYAKYVEPTTTSTNLNNLFSALVSAFSLNPSGGTGLEGQAAYNSFNSMFGGGAFIGDEDWDEDAPKAYLNYILFDENFMLVDFGFEQISTNAEQVGDTPVVPHDYLSLHVKVKQKGYLYIYLSNEQPVQTNVYFDDFKIVHHTAVEQMDDYYPFGLTFNSYQRENATKNKYLYNDGAEREDALDLGIDYTKFRNYDPALGRWWQNDPKADEGDLVSLTPFNYSFNNPVRYNDPEGDCPPGDPNCNGGQRSSSSSNGPSIGALLNAAVEAASTIVDFFFGSGNDGSAESAARMGEAHNTMQAVGVEAQNMRNDLENAFGDVPGLGSALSVMSASQAETTGETMQHLGDAALKANSIPVVGGVRSGTTTSAKLPRGTDFVVTSKGESIVVPKGATGPSSPKSGSGMVYQGGQGGKGLDGKVTGVRIMDAKGGAKPDGQRVIYMNQQGQTVNPVTGKTVPKSDPSAHQRLKEY